MRAPILVGILAAAGLGVLLTGCGGNTRRDDAGPPLPCGNSKFDAGEGCDDGNTAAGDGCSASCQIEAGWACYGFGSPCMAARCGDSLLAGLETCDDGNALAGDGCSSSCQIEDQLANGDGWSCATPGQPCQKTVCRDGNLQGNEQCDDGLAGHPEAIDNPFDGCYQCRLTTSCSATQGCASVCGDGLKALDEECDDGNSHSNDGCSATCRLESIPGITCTLVTSELPAAIDVSAVFRDFKAYSSGQGHPDFENFHCSEVSPGLAAGTLDGVTGKPVFAKKETSQAGCGHDGASDQLMLTGSDQFKQWYTDVEGVNLPAIGAIHLTRQPDDAYLYDSAANGSPGFFPIDGLGFGNEGRDHNFHFTTEVRYWFTYQGGENLAFAGDDDVWVFINGKLAVDLGGLHPRQQGGITLDAGKAAELGLAAGDTYEMALFHAERHTEASNFKLTLGKFVKARTDCVSVCGDGIKAPNEECDEGSNNGHGFCSADCHLIDG